MTVYEQAIIDSRIETAQNEIRAEHNEMESRRVFGKKSFLPYHSEKFISMIKLFMDD